MKKVGTAYKKHRAFIRPNPFPTLAEGTGITSASLILNLSDGTSTARPIHVYKMNVSKQSADINWSALNTSGNYTLIKPSVSAERFRFSSGVYSNYSYTADITSTVRSFYGGSLVKYENRMGNKNNYGFMVSYATESASNPDYNAILSAEYATVGMRPVVIVGYPSPSAKGAIENGVYYIRNLNSGKYLDVTNSSVNSGSSAIQYELQGGKSQQWTVFYDPSDGYYTIRPRHAPTMALGLASETGASTNGTVAKIYTCNISYPHQKWSIHSAVGGGYQIGTKASNSSKVLEIDNSSTANGGVAQIWTYSTTRKNDNWEFINVSTMNSDPFDLSNVDYIRYTKIPIIGKNPSSYLLSVVKSKTSADNLFTAFREENGTSRSYIINEALKLELIGLLGEYDRHPIKTAACDDERAAYNAVIYTQKLVESGYFTVGSSEYYGVWAYNYTEFLKLYNYMQAAIDNASKAYQVYCTLLSFYSSSLATGSTKTIGAAEYTTKAGYVQQIESRLGSNISNKTVISAAERNTATGLSQPPYKADTPVIGFKTTKTTRYVRVFKDSKNVEGKWMMKYEDMKGLTPAQIRSKFALPDTPTHYCYVDVPAGKQMYTGIVEPNFGQPGLGVQFEAGQYLDPKCFSKDHIPF